MFKSKSIQLLKLFTEEELKRFGDFLNSPYFNNNGRVARLFSELKKYHPEYISGGVEKEKLYSKLFPGKKYNEQVMKNLISELFRLAKKFLSVDNYCASSAEVTVGLLNQLAYRNSGNIFIKEAESFKQDIAGMGLSAEKENLFLYRTSEECFVNNMLNNQQSIVSEDIERSGEHLTIFFLRAIIKLSLNNHINRFSFNLDIEKNFPDMLISSIDMEKLLQYMEMHNISAAGSVKLAYYALKAVLDTGDETAYKRYKELLYKNVDNMNKEEAHLFLHFMESVCAHRINSGRSDMYKDLFETYKYEVKHSVYSTKPGIITVLKFRNICLTALRVGEYDWVEKFINDFKGKLQKENRKNITELVLAQLNFERKDYSKCLEHLNKIKTDQIFFKIDVRSLNLMSLYELEHYESALSLTESFKKLLTNNEAFTEQYSSKNINFINTVSAMIKLKIENNPEHALQLKEKLEGYDVISNKKWLRKKMEDFIITETV